MQNTVFLLCEGGCVPFLHSALTHCNHSLSAPSSVLLTDEERFNTFLPIRTVVEKRRLYFWHKLHFRLMLLFLNALMSKQYSWTHPNKIPLCISFFLISCFSFFLVCQAIFFTFSLNNQLLITPQVLHRLYMDNTGQPGNQGHHIP